MCRNRTFVQTTAAFHSMRKRQTLSAPEADFWRHRPDDRRLSTGFAPLCVAYGLRLERRMQTAAALARAGGSPGFASSPARTLTDVSAVPVRTPRVVAIGGGTGLPSVLEGLCGLAAEDGATGRDHISAIVTVMDEGGSSGRLRREFGVLPPGDVRNCLAALAGTDSPFRPLLQHRFADGGGLEGHAIGNLLLTALTQITGDF